MGSNAQRRREEREKKVAQLRKADQSRQRRSTTLLTIGLVIAVVVAIGGVWWAVEAGTEDPTPGALDEVQTYDYTGSDHTESDGIPVDYEESPPVGGRHSPVWLDCTGVVYDEPVASEQAVHALEHGAVWITYDPSLPQGDVDTLADQVDGSGGPDRGENHRDAGCRRDNRSNSLNHSKPHRFETAHIQSSLQNSRRGRLHTLPLLLVKRILDWGKAEIGGAP